MNRTSPQPPDRQVTPAGAGWSRIGGDLSGAFADLGTFLPLVMGIFAVHQTEPTGLLVGFGLFALVTALVYRRPVPVQPMKAAAAVAIAGGLGAGGVAASGILIGVVLIGLAAFGLVSRFGRWIPSTVMHGIQLGVGLYLAWAGVGLLAADALVGGAALLFLLLVSVTRFKPLAALALLLIAVVWGLMHAPPGAAALRLAPGLPTFGLPDLQALWTASRDVLLPQLALTLTNATVITAAIAAEYFPRDRARITPDRLAMSTGVMNLVLAPFGAFPMCHGAGGLVVQHRFGARSGLAPAIFGTTCLGLGVLLGPNALAVLALLPMPAIGALLVVAGVDLAISRRLRQASHDRLLVIGVTGVSCVLGNVAIGLLVGVLLELLRRRLVPANLDPR